MSLRLDLNALWFRSLPKSCVMKICEWQRWVWYKFFLFSLSLLFFSSPKYCTSVLLDSNCDCFPHNFAIMLTVITCLAEEGLGSSRLDGIWIKSPAGFCWRRKKTFILSLKQPCQKFSLAPNLGTVNFMQCFAYYRGSVMIVMSAIAIVATYIDCTQVLVLVSLARNFSLWHFRCVFLQHLNTLFGWYAKCTKSGSGCSCCCFQFFKRWNMWI